MDDVVAAGEPEGFDALMASLRSSADDVDVLFDVLRRKLLDALGPIVRVQDDKARWRRPAVRSITVALGDRIFEASLSEQRLTLLDRQSVRGITLRSDELDLPGWFAAFVAALRAEAERSTATRGALERLLIGD